MMESIKAFLQKRNLIYKFVSLVLAVLLWLTITEPFS